MRISISPCGSACVAPPLVHETLGTAGPGAVRFSVGHFNTDAEIDRDIEAKARIAGNGK